MTTFNKINYFVEDLAKKVHNLSSDAITVALCASANAPVATNHTLSDLTQISYTNLSARVPSITSCVQTSGTLKLILVDLTMTASGGSVAAFRYVVLYNDTAASDNLIGWYDYGSSLTLADGDSFTIDFDGSGGVLTIA